MVEKREGNPEKLLPNSDSTKEVFARAGTYTKGRGNHYIGVSHLFYGLMTGEQEDPFRTALVDRGVTVDKVVAAIDATIPKGESPITTEDESPGSPAIWPFIIAASHNAREKGRQMIEPSDLWTVLLTRTEGATNRYLTEFDINGEEIVAEVDGKE